MNITGKQMRAEGGRKGGGKIKGKIFFKCRKIEDCYFEVPNKDQTRYEFQMGFLILASVVLRGNARAQWLNSLLEFQVATHL